MSDTDPSITALADTIERSLWQSLADALNQLSEWGVDPLLALADRIGENKVVKLDPLERDHMLRYQPPYVPDPANPQQNLPFGWHVIRRETEPEAIA